MNKRYRFIMNGKEVFKNVSPGNEQKFWNKYGQYNPVLVTDEPGKSQGTSSSQNNQQENTESNLEDGSSEQSKSNLENAEDRISANQNLPSEYDIKASKEFMDMLGDGYMPTITKDLTSQKEDPAFKHLQNNYIHYGFNFDKQSAFIPGLGGNYITVYSSVDLDGDGKNDSKEFGFNDANTAASMDEWMRARALNPKKRWQAIHELSQPTTEQINSIPIIYDQTEKRIDKIKELWKLDPEMSDQQVTAAIHEFSENYREYMNIKSSGGNVNNYNFKDFEWKYQVMNYYINQEQTEGSRAGETLNQIEGNIFDESFVSGGGSARGADDSTHWYNNNFSASSASGNDYQIFMDAKDEYKKAQWSKAYLEQQVKINPEFRIPDMWDKDGTSINQDYLDMINSDEWKQIEKSTVIDDHDMMQYVNIVFRDTHMQEFYKANVEKHAEMMGDNWMIDFKKAGMQVYIEDQLEGVVSDVKKESNKLKLVYDDYENSANTLTTLANELNNQYTPDIVEKKIGELKFKYGVSSEEQIKAEIERIKSKYDLTTQEGVDAVNKAIRLLEESEQAKIDSLNGDEWFVEYKDKIDNFNSIKNDIDSLRNVVKGEEDKFQKYLDNLGITETQLAVLDQAMSVNYTTGNMLAMELVNASVDLVQGLIDVSDMVLSLPFEIAEAGVRSGNPELDAYLKANPQVKTQIDQYADKSILAKWSYDIEQWQTENRKTYRAPVAYSDIDGFGDAGEWVAATLFRQAPQLTLMAATGGASLYVLGASSAGSKWRELNDMVDLYERTGGLYGQDFSYANMFANAAFTGTMEGLSERITLGQVKRMKGALGGDSWKLGFTNGVKKNFFSYQGLKRNGGIYLKDSFSEGFSEVVAQFSSNLADIASGVEGTHIYDGLQESFASGWVVSNGLKIPSAGRKLASPFISKDNNQKMGEIANEINALTTKLGNLNISPVERSKIENRIATLTQKSNKLLQSDIKRIDLLKDKDKKALIDIDRLNFESRKKAQKIMLNNKLTKEQKKKQINKLQAEVNKRAETKNAILSKYPPDVVDRNYKNKIATMRKMADMAKQHGAPEVSIREVKTKKFIDIKARDEQKGMSSRQVAEIRERNQREINAYEKIIADPKSKPAEVAAAKKALKIAKGQVNIANQILKSNDNGVMIPTFDKKGNITKLDIVINKDTSIKNGKLNTAAHEFIHAVFANTLKFDPQMREILGEQLMKILTGKGVRFSSEAKRKEFAKRVSLYDASKQGEEMLAIAAEMMIDGDIIFNDSILTKLAGVFRRFTQNVLGWDIEFNNTNDIKNFLRDYHYSITRNKPNEAISRMLANGANGKMFEDAKTPAERENLSMESKAVDVVLKNNEDLRFNKNGTGFDDILWETDYNKGDKSFGEGRRRHSNDEEFKASQEFWKGYSKIVDTKDLDGIIMSHLHNGKPLYDVILPTKGLSKKQAIDKFIREVKERAGEKYLSEFNSDKNDSLFGWLTGHGGGQGRSIIYRSRGDVMNRMNKEDFGISLDQTITEETGTTRADMIEDTKSDYITRLEEADLSKPVKQQVIESVEELSMVMDSINLPNEIKSSVRSVVRRTSISLEGLTYKNIRDLLISTDGKVTSEKNVVPTGPMFGILNSISAEFGVDPLRILAKQDLNSEQRQSAQKYILDKVINEDGSFNTSLLDALPEGQDRDGRATGVANTKLGQLYTKGDRAKYKQGATAAGLATQNKRTDITKEEFLDLFGINPDGTFRSGAKADGAIRELIVQISQLAANQEIRLNAIDNTLEKSSIIAKLGDGKSESMFSTEGDTPSLIKNDYQMSPKDIANLIDQRLIPGSGKNKRLNEIYDEGPPPETFGEARDRIINSFTHASPQFRRILALGLTGGSRATAKTMTFFNTIVPPIEGEINDIRTKYTDKGILTLPKDVNNKEFYENELNKLTTLKDFFIAIQEYLDTNPKDAWLFLEMLRDSSAAGQNHIIRRLAPFTFYPVDPETNLPVENLEIREEHTDPQNQIGTALMMAAIRGNVNDVFDVIGQSYMQGGLIMKHDDMVNDAGFQSTMPDIYFKLIIPRLKSGELKLDPGMSSVVRMAVSGVDLNNYMLVGSNQTIVEYFGLPRIRNASKDVVAAQNELITNYLAGQVESMPDAVNGFNNKYLSLDPNGNTLASQSKNFEDNEINMSNSVDLVSLSLNQNNSLMSKEPPKVKGMSTFDFDDTLARTKSGVRYTMPNNTGEAATSRKVIFLAGSAGSGKSNVVAQLGLENKGFKIVNQDIALEWLVKNSGLPTDMRDFTPEQASKWGSLQWEARDIAQRKAMKFRGRGDGVVVDGTGASTISLFTQAQKYKDAGYDVQMLFVDSSLDIALERNRNRKERSLQDFIVERNWKAVQANKKAFKEEFGENFNEVNTDNLQQGDPMPVELVDKMDEFADSYIKGRLTAEEFANKGGELLKQGAKFDFSEFNKVVDGTPGPLLEKARNRAKKFGTKDMFVLTARPQQSAFAIQQFLKGQGLDIPIENITGLADSTGEAKAQWMLDKFAEGYNDMYFVDDAIQNVTAVRDVLNQLDIKSKVVQAKLNQTNRLVETDTNAMQSKVLNPKTEQRIDRLFNEMIERRKGVDANKRFSAAEARKRGSQPNIIRFFKSLYIPPSAEDFKGLLYYFLGSGKQGEADLKFFADKLLKPFAKGIRAWNTYKQKMVDEYKTLKKQIPSVGKALNVKVPGTNFTNDTAIRVYLWTKAGFEIPGISKSLQNKLIRHVKNNPDLKLFADSLSKISRRKDGYIPPSENWMMESIPTDLRNIVERIGRKEFLSEWINNKNVIFSPENLNKI